ncbi:hypothetical protein [Pseudomonas sp. NPDC090592]|uniref:hypothetical protein n=1 Tax=Pseudomonas sp. NPDC090592 TaxID=3364480 RepID=UPI00383A1BD1
MDSQIKLQMQPCPVSCVSTCMAMIVDRPAEELIREFHHAYRNGDITLRNMLDYLGVTYTAFYSVDCPPLADEGVYLCTAPSLNIQAGNHQILIEVTDDGYFVHDPVQGREERKFYVSRGAGEENGLAVDLGGFVVDAFISREQVTAARTDRHVEAA